MALRLWNTTTMRFRQAALVWLFALACPVASAAGDASRCYGVRDPDRRNACLAETRDAKRYCYSIQAADRRQFCLAQTTREKSRCYNLRDKDLRAVCLAGMGR